jgi:hypothetical protein
MVPESNDLSSALTVCAIVSTFLNVTVAPADTVIEGGAYAESLIATVSGLIAAAGREAENVALRSR